MPLRRNREFMLLQTGQLLSSAGSQATAIAYPLLVLGLTGSAARAGAVAFARTLPLALFSLPAGLAADRWSRRRLMVAADAVRALALAALAVAVAAGDLAFWPITVVAFIEGTGNAVFAAAYPGALRAVVPRRQLPTAAGAQTGRQAAVYMVGPPLGGALFELGRAIPFAVDAVSYTFSTGSLLAMRTRFQEERVAEEASLRSRLTEGARFLWGQPFLRTCALIFGVSNFIGPGILLTIVVVGRRQGLTGGEVGLLVAAFAAAMLVGSAASTAVRRALPVRAVLLLELWLWVGCALFLVWPSVYVLAAGMLGAGFAIPSTDSVVHGYRIAMTPDRLLGRSESVRSTLSLLIAPLGPLLAGALLGVSARATVAAFAAAALALAMWATLSPALRAAPSMDELDGTMARCSSEAT
jgi:hypothetical protein